MKPSIARDEVARSNLVLQVLRDLLQGRSLYNFAFRAIFARQHVAVSAAHEVVAHEMGGISYFELFDSDSDHALIFLKIERSSRLLQAGIAGRRVG